MNNHSISRDLVSEGVEQEWLPCPKEIANINKDFMSEVGKCFLVD